VPERAGEDEVDANGEREDDDGGGEDGGRTRIPLCYRFDALS
jgi:hypothetical protein